MRDALIALTFVLSVNGVALAQEAPTITWDEGSPVQVPGRRISASGKYTVPEPAGGVSWSVIKVEVMYQAPNSTLWSPMMASHDKNTKTWLASMFESLTPGTYKVKGRMTVERIYSPPPPPFPGDPTGTPTTTTHFIELDEKNVTIVE